MLTNAQNYQNYIVFVVRDDSRVAALLYQQPVTTYQAYNDYPYDGTTGKSLYAFNSYGATTVGGTKGAVKVSFDRPYMGDGVGRAWGNFILWEVAFIRWMEKSGYDVTYSTDLDTHTDGGRLLNYHGFLSRRARRVLVEADVRRRRCRARRGCQPRLLRRQRGLYTGAVRGVEQRGAEPRDGLLQETPLSTRGQIQA